MNSINISKEIIYVWIYKQIIILTNIFIIKKWSHFPSKHESAIFQLQRLFWILQSCDLMIFDSSNTLKTHRRYFWMGIWSVSVILSVLIASQTGACLSSVKIGWFSLHHMHQLSMSIIILKITCLIFHWGALCPKTTPQMLHWTKVHLGLLRVSHSWSGISKPL